MGSRCLAVIVITIDIVVDLRVKRNVNTNANSTVSSNGEAGKSSSAAPESPRFTYDDEKHKLFQAAGITKDKSSTAEKDRIS